MSENDINAIINGGSELNTDILERISSQIRTSINSFISQSGSSGIEIINFVSSLSHTDFILSSLKKNLVEYKIQLLNPFKNISSPSQLKSRIVDEKNKSSFSVALGLASRRLDIFGYFKLVKAVANINLIPNREKIIEKEKKKSKEAKLTNNILFSSILGLTLILIFNFYVVSISPTNQQFELISSDISKVQNKITKLNSELSKNNNYVKNFNVLNKKIVDLTILNNLPKESYVKELNHRRIGISEITIKSAETQKIYDFITVISKEFINVRLLEIVSIQNDSFKLYKIVYQIKR